jgi:hypothetical protein
MASPMRSRSLAVVVQLKGAFVVASRIWRRAFSAAGLADPRRSLRGTVPGAAQAGLSLWRVWRQPALSLQRLRRPSSPALARIPRETRSSAAAVLRCAAALRVQVGRPVA